HRFRFGLALSEDDVGFGFALRARCGSAAFGFGDLAHLIGFGQRFNATALNFGALQNGRDQLALVPLDLEFLHLYLLLLLDLAHLDLFGDYLLLHDIGLNVVGLVGLGLLLLSGFEVLRTLDIEVALRFGLLGL